VEKLAGDSSIFSGGKLIDFGLADAAQDPQGCAAGKNLVDQHKLGAAADVQKPRQEVLDEIRSLVTG
jgi:hypothetical protein